MPPTPGLRNLDFGSNLGVLGSGRGSKRRGAPIGSIATEFELKRSHGDPFRDQNHDSATISSLVLANYYLVLSNHHLVLTNDHLVLTNDYLVLTKEYLVVTSVYLLVTIDYWGCGQ